MKRVTSAGGVVVLGNSVLMLKKTNGDWVLPKGRIEENESSMQAATREVREETGIKAVIEDYIGTTNFKFKNVWTNNEIVSKDVRWYLMKKKGGNLVPQKEEGFVEAKFIHEDKVDELIKYSDEKEIVKRGLKIVKGE